MKRFPTPRYFVRCRRLGGEALHYTQTLREAREQAKGFSQQDDTRVVLIERVRTEIVELVHPHPFVQQVKQSRRKR